MPKAPPPIGDVVALVHRELIAAGRVDLSLRTIGERVGVSARMLVHYFGTREQLVRAVLDHERALQREALDALLARGAGPIQLLRDYFRAVTEPSSVSRLRFFFDLVAEAGRNPDAFAGFLEHDLVGYWKVAMTNYLEHTGNPNASWDIPSIALATARGLYLEALSGAAADDLRRRYDILLRLLEYEIET